MLSWVGRGLFGIRWLSTSSTTVLHGLTVKLTQKKLFNLALSTIESSLVLFIFATRSRPGPAASSLETVIRGDRSGISGDSYGDLPVQIGGHQQKMLVLDVRPGRHHVWISGSFLKLSICAEDLRATHSAGRTLNMRAPAPWVFFYIGDR